MGLRVILVAASGFLIVQAHTIAPVLALICLVPLLIALYAPTPPANEGDPPAPLSRSRATLMGFLAYAFAAAPVMGMGQYGWTIYGAAVLYLALGGAIFGLLASPFIRAESRVLRCFGITAAWILAEYTRTLTAYSYPVLLGPCLGGIPILSQLASLAGPWGLDGFVALLSASLAEAIEARFITRHPWLPRTRPIRWVAAAVVLTASVLTFGAVRLSLAGHGAITWHSDQTRARPEGALVVSMLQGGIPTWLYRRAGVFERLQQVVDTNYLSLYDQALAQRPWGQPPDWIIFPEAAFGRTIPPGEPGLDKLTGLRDRALPPHTSVLLGTTTDLSGRYDPNHPAAIYENAIMALEGNPPRLVDTTTKGLLVPIAEARFKPAQSWRPLKTAHANVGALICYESLYPHIAHGMAAAGAEVLVVITNDAGMRWSLAPRVHARLGRLRAIETGMSLLHAGQAGITFAVDPYGQSTPEIGLFERGVLTVAVPRQRVWTLYALVGEGWVALCALLWALGLVLNRRMRAKSTMKESA